MGWLVGANAWLTQALGASTGIASFGLLFVGGTLASLLPCVYPLYPITAAVLARRESRFGRHAHPVVYYTGLSTVYFIFGVVASATGGSFNTILRLPATNLAIGALLVLMALATSGLLHFPTLAASSRPSAAGNRGALESTFAMGAGAGLLSSACVGPVVVSILISLASATQNVSPSIALVAGTKMMLFGMGVGLPMLAIGLFGVALPRAGVWMIRVQQLFGLLIGWFALGYVDKGLRGAGFTEGQAMALLVGIVLVAGAAFAAQTPERSLHDRTKYAMLALTFVLGIFVMGRVMVHGGTPVAHAVLPPGVSTSVPPTATAQELVEQHGNLTWYLDRDAAYAAAAQLGRPVFVDFHGDWCTNCKAFDDQTLRDRDLNAALREAVLLKVRDTTALFDEYRRDPRFPELRVGLPFFLITDARGQLLYKTSDYTQTKEMALFLPQPKSDEVDPVHR